MSSRTTSDDGLPPLLGGSHPVQCLLRGTLSPKLDAPSLIFFTVHRSASAFVAYQLARIAQSAGIIPIDFETLVYEYTDRAIAPYVSREFLEAYRGECTSLPEEVCREIQQRIPARGFFYGAIRGIPFFHHLPHFDQFKTLLMVRDPRDVLTSLFFSVAFSHGEPTGVEDVRRVFLAAREHARSLGIDQYVLASAPVFRKTYTSYCHEVLGRPNSLLVKYEDMIRDFPAWLNQVLVFWGVQAKKSAVAAVIREADFAVSHEDPHSHKRQVQPGDHLRKLQPETIRALNETFADVLDALGYRRSSSGNRDAA